MITRISLSLRARDVARALGIVAAVAATLVAGCHDSPTQPLVDQVTQKGHMAVYAVAPAGVSTLVVEVTGPGIVKANGSPDTLVFNISMSGGVGTGSVEVPPGPSRTFTVRAFEGVTETHRGAATVDIVTGNNPAISITLIPFVGTTPITVSIGTTLVIVSPTTRVVEIGDTLRLASQVIDQNGAYLSGGVVRWASLNPVKAQVDTLGLVTMRDTGDVQIVATYGTVGGSAKLTGANHRSGISYHLTWNGRASQDWTDTTNWTAQGVAVARVPTGSDSVVIAATATRMPRLNGCAAATARDLVVEAGATLDYGCAYNVGINVSHSAVIKGTINVDVRAQRTASLAGRFSRLFVVGDSVKLADTTLATSLDISGLGSQLLLSGKPLTVNGVANVSQGSKIALGGASMTVTSSLTLNDSSWVEMTDVKDTLNVRGSLDLGTKDTRTGNFLSAGTLRLGGSLYANSRFSFAPSGTHQTIIDGTSYQYLQVDSVALNLGTWQNVTIRNPGQVTFTYYSASNDSIALPNFQLEPTAGRVEFDYRRWGVTPASGTLTVTDTVYSYYGTVRVNGAMTLASRAAAPIGSPSPAKAMLTGPGAFVVAGAFTSDAASIVDAGNLYLQDASGTANADGAFSPGTLHLTALQPTLKPGLPYNGLALHGTRTGVTVTGATTFTGPATFSDGSRLVLGGKTLNIGGALQLNDSSWVEMTNSLDSLNVRGNLTMGKKDTRTGNLLSAGTLRVGGYFTANNRFSFAASGSHTTILDGTGYQNVAVDSSALNLGSWPNLTIRNPSQVTFSYYSTSNDSIALPNFQIDAAAGRVELDYRRWGITPAGGTLTVTDTLYSYYGTVRVNGALSLASRPAAPIGSPAAPKAMLTGTGSFYVTGALTADAGSVVNVNDLYLLDATGTGGVSGSFSPVTLHLLASQPALNPGLAYRNLDLIGTRNGVLLSGATTLTGNATLSSGSRLVVNGQSLTVTGDLALSDTSWVEMTNALDLLNVRGNFTAGRKDTRTGGLLSAGTMRVGGYFTANSRFSFAPSGTHATILDGTGFQNLSVDSVALNLGAWQNLTIRNPSKVTFNYYSTTSDSIALPNFQIEDAAGRVDFNYRRWGITPAGGKLMVTDTLYSYYGTVRVAGALTMASRPAAPIGSPAAAKAMLTGPGAFVVSGAFTSDAASIIDAGDLYLQDASGTSNADGSFSPATLHLGALQPALKPGLPYRNLELNATRSGVTLTGPTSVTGNATLNAGSRLALGNWSFLVTGTMTMNDSSWVEMTNPLDTLNVRGNLTFGSKDTRTGSLLSAGALRVGGNLRAISRFSFATSGAHETIVDGGGYQSLQLDSAALNLGTLQNLSIRNTGHTQFSYASTTSDSIAFTNFQLDPAAGGMDFYYRRWSIAPKGGALTLTDTLYLASQVRVKGSLTMQSRPAAPVGSPASAKVMVRGAGPLVVEGAFTTDAGSVVDINEVNLLDPSGTANVDGASTFTPSIVRFLGTSQTVKAGLGYKAMEVGGSATVSGGPLVTTNTLTLLNANSSFNVPDGSSIGSTIYTYGNLTFDGGATSPNYLYVYPGGRATAATRTNPIDVLSIYVYGISGTTPGGILDNTNGGVSTGFRYKSPGGSYNNFGTLIGQTPSTHP